MLSKLNVSNILYLQYCLVLQAATVPLLTPAECEDMVSLFIKNNNVYDYKYFPNIIQNDWTIGV